MKNLSEKDLETLSGQKARLWRFLPSHDRLVFLLKDLVKEEDRYLIFLGCEQINITVLWSIQNPVIKNGDVASYVLTDGDIKIQFEESRIMGNYDLE